MPSPRRIQLGVLAAATALAVAACSPGTPSAEDTATEGEEAAAASSTTVRFRLWDEVAAPAYEESFDAFMAQHPEILVEVEVVPWEDYWDRLALDLAGGEMADVFWTNTATFGRYADEGDLIDVGEVLGDARDAWEESVADLYRRGGTQWGVPQLWDAVALYYNTEMVVEAGVEPSELRWVPGAGEGDTLLESARALTTDADGAHPQDEDFEPEAVETYGFNAQADPQAVYLNFLAQNGARYQDGDRYTFAGPEGEQAFEYLVDLVDTHHVAPPAADTNAEETLPRDLFLQERLGLFQSGSYDLRTVHDNADFEWGLAPMVAGPEGRVGVVYGVAAVGNAHTHNMPATTEVLRWLASAPGQQALASQGVAFPAAVGAQQTYVDYWAERGVDVRVFLEAARGPTVPPPLGPEANAAANAMEPILEEMFLGRIPVPEALELAQAAGNEAVAH